MKVKSESEVTQSCPTLSDPMDCGPPGSSVHGILQARMLEWVASASPLGSGMETNRDHSVVFEIASKYCISDSFVDHHGYSISSERFLPTVVDIMVI